MANKIKIDIISDVVCPWCIIGYKRLTKAISKMGIEDMIELEWQPFELNPDMPVEGEDVQIYGARKYGRTPEEGIRSRANIAKLGAQAEFVFDFFDEMKIVNTQDAHILLDYAKESAKQTELKMRLFEAFFCERKDISDQQVLAQELQTVGLNVEEALATLEDDVIRERVQSQKSYWHGLGVSSVPTVVFNNSSAITGAQPIDVYKQVLTELMGKKKCILNEQLF